MNAQCGVPPIVNKKYCDSESFVRKFHCLSSVVVIIRKANMCRLS